MPAIRLLRCCGAVCSLFSQKLLLDTIAVLLGTVASTTEGQIYALSIRISLSLGARKFIVFTAKQPKQTDTAAGKRKETIDRPETEDDWWGPTWCDAKILALLGSCPLT
jgi:hypothetical protein